MENADTGSSKQLTFYKLVVSTLGLAFIGVCVLFGILLTQTWREYNAFEEREAQYRERLSEVNRQKSGREAYMKKLLNDSVFRERVIRERLGYSKDDEIIFQFGE